MQVVTIDKKGRAQQRVAHVSYTDHDKLMWVALGDGGPWRITFDKPPNPSAPFAAGSPFTGPAYYTVPQGDAVQTNGGPNAGTAGKTYKFNIRDENNPTVIKDDPDVDVDP